VNLLPTTTSADERRRNASTAILPIGSYEQHGDFLPLTTDTIIACAIAQRIAQDHDLFLLPPITISCSHEHAGFSGTVSIKATTLTAVVEDILESLEHTGVRELVLVNGHGGNYVLKHVAQQANISMPRVLLFPSNEDWSKARLDAGIETNNHDDMHAGELETSILLHVAPELLRPGYDSVDHLAPERPDLLLLGIQAYAQSGVIGRPSLGTAEKGSKALASLTSQFRGRRARLRAEPNGRRS
jgi:creatinine amidohydrolase